MLLASAARAQSTSTEAQAIAQEAYVFLYPLILMDLTRKQLTNADPKHSAFGGPANAFVNIRAFPTAEMRAVVRPNFDTLYSSAWLDLSEGPVVVSTADTGGRYFMLPMLDMWTDVFAVPGKRTTGTGAASFAVVPPGWTGKLPDGVDRIDSPTPHVWVIGRTQTNGVKDYAAVHKVQDGYKITPLADWGKAPRKVEQKIDPSVDTKTEPLRQVGAMPAAEFFKYAGELMKQNPPHVTDWSRVARMKRIGLEPGKSFDVSKISADDLAKGAAAGLKLMQDKADHRPRHQRLADEHRYDGRLRRLLSQARHRGDGRPRGQSGRGCDLSAQRCRRRRQASHGPEQLCAAIRQGRAAAGRGLLVADDVRCGRLPGRQCVEPLRHRRP
jgi:hypothetical protein